jgi:antitoxin component YwqK of YwqJK toxin-antitoxin module
MKLGILTICILTSICALGQETVLKERKGESYYVLKDDPKIKHGAYQFSNKKGLIEKGQYDNDKKIGVWEFYDKDGNLEQKYNYTSNQLIFNKEVKQFVSYKIIMDGKPTDIVPDTPPVFIGGLSKYDRFIANNLKYPGESKSKGIEGRQLVLMSLSKQGDIVGTSIYRAIAPDIDNEALRLINELPKEWIPARHQNENVGVLVGLPVSFILK